MSDRRAFLKLLARGAVYAAPVVASFTVPAPSAGQGTSSQHKSMGAEPPATQQSTPWDAPAPGQQPPPGGRARP